MIPLRDLNPTLRRPVLVYGIIAVNVLVFLATLEDLGAAARQYGAVAYHFTGQDPELLLDARGRLLVEPVPPDDGYWIRTLTHFWVHGGWMHIIGNMWFLWVFGDNVEDVLGRARFVLLYVVSALVALTLQVVADPSSGIPMVGASGAIGGVLGGYLRLFPKAKVVALVPLGFIYFSVLWPAAAFLLVWFGLQVFNAFGPAVGGGVAWWAHVGGFAAGYLLASMPGRSPRTPLAPRPPSGPRRIIPMRRYR